MRAFTGAIIAISMAALLACAGANVSGARRYADDSDIPKPSVVLVYPFALDANDVAIDTYGLRSASSSQMSSEERRVQNKLVEALVSKLNERGINAMRGGQTGTIPPDAFLIKGQFVTQGRRKSYHKFISLDYRRRPKTGRHLFLSLTVRQV